MDKGLTALREREFYKRQSPTAAAKLESFFTVRTMLHAINNIRDEACGGSLPFEKYPDRPDGGKWFAMGSRYPADYDWDKNYYHNNSISGECAVSLPEYCGHKKITLCDYDCALGRTHQGYSSTKYMKHSMTRTDTLKMMYAIHTDSLDDLPVINIHCFENIEGYTKL